MHNSIECMFFQSLQFVSNYVIRLRFPLFFDFQIIRPFPLVSGPQHDSRTINATERLCRRLSFIRKQCALGALVRSAEKPAIRAATMEAITKRIEVMKEFQSYLKILSAYKFDNFRNQDAATVLANIGYALFITCWMATFPVLITLGFWLCVELQFDLDKISSTAPITIHTTQYLLVFLSFSSKNQVISDAIDRLQTIVVRRKCSHLSQYFR